MHHQVGRVTYISLCACNYIEFIYLYGDPLSRFSEATHQSPMNLLSLPALRMPSPITKPGEWDATVCLQDGFHVHATTNKGVGPWGRWRRRLRMPLRVCLLVPTHAVWTSELVLPNWLNAEQERVEVLLFVQASCDSEQAMSVDAVFNENAAVEKDMHLLQVYAIETAKLQDLWRACCTAHPRESRCWQWVAATPKASASGQLTAGQALPSPLNLLPFRAHAAKRYEQGSWLLLCAGLVGPACVLVWVLGSQPQVNANILDLSSTRATAPVPTSTATVAQLRQQLNQLQLQAQQQRTTGLWQQWGLHMLQALSRDMTAHTAVIGVMAQDGRLNVRGQARSVADATAWLQALRARWAYKVDIVLVSSERDVSGAVHVDIEFRPHLINARSGGGVRVDSGVALPSPTNASKP
jgi:Tfp pilus assembly protein PilN